MPLIDTMNDSDARRLLRAQQISMTQVTKRYPTGTLALDNVDLCVNRGEFVAIVGASGCGKSTLLRLAAGLERPSTGTVALGTSSVAFIFQDPNLLPWRTVRRNAELLASLAKVPRAVRERRVSDAIQAVGLAGFADQLPGALSGGMRMRVSLARALALQPEVMLLDEPFGALDELTRSDMQVQLLDLHRRKRFSALFVTHSVSEAVFLAHRVIVMSPRPGRIRAVIDVDLPDERDPALRYEPHFVAQAAAVSELLHAKEQPAW